MIKQGSHVKLHYTLTVDDEVVDSSRRGKPHSYVHGEGQIVSGLEEALEGMQVGEQKKTVVEPDGAYGPHQATAVHRVARSAFSDASNLKPGDRVSGEAQGKPFHATVAEVDSEEITLDLNHPLAGKTLHFDVEIVDVS